MTPDNHAAGSASAMFSVAELCAAYRISRSLLYKKIKAGTGPRLSKCGRRTLISAESAAAWRSSLVQS